MALDCGFLTVVGTDWMLFLSNICMNSGPRNSLPLSWIHFLGLGYQLSHPSSKASATVFDLAFFHRNNFRHVNNRDNTGDSSKLILKVVNNDLPRSYHINMNLIPWMDMTNILRWQMSVRFMMDLVSLAEFTFP